MERISVPRREDGAASGPWNLRSSTSLLLRMLPGSVKGRLLLVLVSVLLPILVAQSFTYSRLWEMRRDQEYQSNLELARAVGVAFENFAKDIAATELALGNAIAWYLQPSNEDATPLLSAALKEYPSVHEISWIGADGRVIFSTEPTSVGTDVHTRPFFQNPSGGREWQVSDLTPSGTDNPPRFAVSRYIRDEGGRLVGTIVAAVDPDRLGEAIRFPRAADGAIALTDGSGRMAYRYPAVATTWERRDWAAADPSFTRALAGEETTAITRGVEGKDEMAARSLIRSLGWVAVASRPAEVAMWPVVTNMMWAPLLFLIATGLGLFLSLLIAQSVSGPLTRLERHARQLGIGKLHMRTDEGGPVEIVRLSESMNRMAAELQARQQQLETERALLEGVVEQMPAGVIVAESPSGRLIRSNRRMPELFGHPFVVSGGSSEHTQWIGFHSDGRRYTRGDWPLARSATTGEVVIDEEIEILRKDGTRAVISASSAPIRDDRGNTIAAVVIDQDITERKWAEQERERLLAELDATLSSIPAGVIVYSKGGDIIRINAAAQELLGYSNDIGPTALEERTTHLAPETPEGNPLAPNAVPATRALRGESFQGVLTRIRPQGREQVWLSTSGAPIKTSNGEMVGAVVIFSDISRLQQLKERQARLLADFKSQAAELEATINAVADAVVIYGSDGAIRRLNPAARKLFGYSLSEEKLDVAERLELLHMKAIDGTAYPAERHPMMRALRGETVSGELAIVRAGGGRRDAWISTSAAPIRGADGEFLGVVGVTMDVSEVHRVQERERDLLRAVTHDLKTPLTAIQGHGQLIGRILEKDGQFPKLMESAEAIVKSSRRMTAMINELSESARLESGQMKIECQPLDLTGFVSELLGRHYQAVPSGRIRVEAADGLPQVQADPNCLERILTNLVGNALKYSPEDTQVVLKTECANGEAVVSVSDQGPGIAKQDLPHLFERFYRAEGAETQEGLGLGLYITRLLVEAHGGRIWAESMVGQGSCFSFALPVESDS